MESAEGDKGKHMEYIRALWSNKTVTVPALAWLFAQTAKVLISIIVYRKYDVGRWFGAGGMPSSHTAYVISLTAVLGKNFGLESTPFGLAVAFSFIVMHDALGVRRAAGKQAKLLNSLMTTHFAGEEFYEKLKELLGHKPLEVFVGGLIGLAIGLNFG